MKKKLCCLTLICLLGAVLSIAEADSVKSTSVKAQQIVSLLPDTQDLQGFTQTQPAGEIGGNEVFVGGRWIDRESPAITTQDRIEANIDLSQKYLLSDGNLVKLWHGHFSSVTRMLYSENEMFKVNITLWLCDSPQAAVFALEDYHANSNAFYHEGSLTNMTKIGDASWACTEYLPTKTLLLRAGSVDVLVSGSPTNVAIKQGTQQSFPDTAVEAVAYQILLRASQQPELTGVTAQSASLAVNGHALPKGALLVAGQTYVPVQAFAKAMDMTSQWDTKTGALTLSGKGHKTVALTAGSTEATVGGKKAAALTVPVLKQNSQPVMTLADLVAVTEAKVTQQTTGSVQVKG